jgi:RimJ/RimL family protein N-acetyltransferase
MNHTISREAHLVRLRPVTVDDAEFIFRLRGDPTLACYLGPSAQTVEDQRGWIERYLQRDQDYYFCIDLLGAAEPRTVGTIGIYDFTSDGRQAEWGRWILVPETQAAAGSLLLIYTVLFEHFELRRIVCRAIEENVQVVRLHDRLRLQRIGRDVEVEVTGGRRLDQIVFALDREQWPTLKKNLEMLARAAEPWLRRR